MPEVQAILSNQHIHGKTCLITGATAGIGYVAARELAARGFRLIVVGRSETRCEAATTAIREATQNEKVDYLLADLSSQNEIRRLAEAVKERYERLDVLVNNAGAINFRRHRTVDGIEWTFAVNHLAYFQLTNLLTDILVASAPSRVVNVSSSSHWHAGRLDLDNLPNPRFYLGHRAYARSKLCNILFTRHLARQLQDDGVTVNALHPGLVYTNIMSNNGLVGRVCNYALKFRGIDVERGAETPVYLAASPEVEGVTGQYFFEKQPAPSSIASQDEDAARRLWALSARLTGVTASVTK